MWSEGKMLNQLCQTIIPCFKSEDCYACFLGLIWFPSHKILINILNSGPTQGRVEGWDAMKPLYFRSVSSKGADWPPLMHHHKGGWNETKWMRWVWRNGGMKFVVGENGKNPEKNLPRPHFVHHETHMEGPRCELGTPAVGGERLTACATSYIFPNSGLCNFSLFIYLFQCSGIWQSSLAYNDGKKQQ